MKEHIKSVKRNTFDDAALFREIRELILSARKTVIRNVDTIQVITNFEIGRRIVKYEQGGKTRAEYGEKILTGGITKTNSRVWAWFFKNKP